MHSPAVKSFVLVVILSLWNQVQAIPPNAVVATDGSGDYKTISDAIAAAPNKSSSSYHILIKAGLYQEYIFVGPEKPNLVLMGEGQDNTVITGSKSAAIGLGTTETATVAIHASGFVAQDLTIENVAGPYMNQAVALETRADYLVFFRCRISGYQDTLYAKKGYQFFRECEILGTIDFICGDATVIFQTCIIYVRSPLPGQSNTITAQKRNYSYDGSGTVISNSKITATDELRQQFPRAKTYLGRPWGMFSRTVIMESFLDDIINPEGWLQWDNQGIEPVYYAEYQNTGPGAITTNRVAWAKIIDNPEEAATFTVRNFIHGEKWIPQNIPYFPDLLPQLQVTTTSGTRKQLTVDRWMATLVLLVCVMLFLL